MLQRCATHIAGFLYHKSELDQSKKAIYQYGTELTLSTAMAVASILLLSALLGNLMWGIIFLVVFISFRLPGGGCKNRHPRPMNIPPQTGQQNGENRSRDTAETSPGVRLQVQAVE